MIDIHDLWILICAIMVLEMQAGFLCLEVGHVRAKNAVNVAVKNITDLCLVSLTFWAVGFAFMFGPSWDGLIGGSGFFYNEDVTGPGDASTYSVFFFQLAFAGTAATIVSGAVAERVRLKGYLLMAICIAALIYPVFGHWAWGGAFVEGQNGWLAALGFIDFAGSTVVHGVGGWVALAYVLAIGPRIGRFGKARRRMEPSNLGVAALGALLLWVGWSGFNAGSTLAFNGEVPEILVNTTLAASAGGLAVLAVFLLRGQPPSASKLFNGALAGLVAVTASCHIVRPPEAIAIGAVGALAMLLASRALERLRIDDALDAAPTHLAAGVWGTLAVALFGDLSAFPSGDRLTQFGVQALGIGVAGLWAFSTAWLCLKAISLITPLRAPRSAERDGLNVAEHNEMNALHELLAELRRLRAGLGGAPSQSRLSIPDASEAGVVATHYNLLLDRAESEHEARERAMSLAEQARRSAEAAQRAMLAAERRSEWAARHDALTGLANLRFLDEMLDSLQTSQLGGGSFAVISIDLGRFKRLNDTYGHAAGDHVLRVAGLALRHELRESDFLARRGGDEFVAIIEAPRHEGQVEKIAQRLLKRLQAPIAFEQATLSIGASVGFALSTQDCAAPRDVLARADLALLKAKENGRDQVAAFSEALEGAAQSRLRLGEDLKTALRRGEFEPYFQPQFDARRGVYSGVEALARWRHPELGVLTPGDFLPIAEEIELTEAIDAAILDQALAALAEWEASGLPAPRVAVNVSAQRLRSGSLIEELRSRGVPADGRLSFEVLETVFIDAGDSFLSWRIDELREMGVEIEIDDFGTGHASISSILALKPQRLKLDRLFVDGVERDERRRGLMRSLVGVARSVGVDMVAEGIENAEQAAILLEEGCTHLQGFALARPMDRARFDAWLAAGARPAIAVGEAADKLSA